VLAVEFSDPPRARAVIGFAVKLGERGLARSLLAAFLQYDPKHEQALLWYAALAETPEEGIRILEQLLRLRPYNQRAKSTLDTLRLNTQANSKGSGHYRDSESAPPPPVTTNRAVVCALCQWQDVGSPRRRARCGVVFDIGGLPAGAFGTSGGQRTATPRRGAALGAERTPYQELRGTDQSRAGIPQSVSLERRPRPHAKGSRTAARRPKVRRTLEQLRARKLVLAVDDSITVRRIVSIILGGNGYRVAIGCDGRGTQACLDVAQALAIGELRETQAQKLIPTGKTFFFMPGIAFIAVYAASEFPIRQKTDQL